MNEKELFITRMVEENLYHPNFGYINRELFDKLILWHHYYEIIDSLLKNHKKTLEFKDLNNKYTTVGSNTYVDRKI